MGTAGGRKWVKWVQQVVKRGQMGAVGGQVVSRRSGVSSKGQEVESRSGESSRENMWSKGGQVEATYKKVGQKRPGDQKGVSREQHERHVVRKGSSGSSRGAGCQKGVTWGQQGNRWSEGAK